MLSGKVSKDISNSFNFSSTCVVLKAVSPASDCNELSPAESLPKSIFCVCASAKILSTSAFKSCISGFISFIFCSKPAKYSCLLVALRSFSTSSFAIPISAAKLA